MRNYEQGKEEGAFIFFLIIVVIVILIWQPKWFQKWWTGVQEGTQNIVMLPKPHDCEFSTAPLGEKHCHYDKVIQKVMWAKSTKGEPIRSYDGGKTWYPHIPGQCYADQTFDCPEQFDPPRNDVPMYPTVTGITVGWTKVED